MKFAKPKRWVNRVFLHCSASDHTNHDNVATMRKWHKERGWSDVGYHFFIRKDGTLERGRPIERTPAAQARHNRGTIAICLHGLKKDKFTDAQFRTLRTLCYQINAAYGGKITFHGHREVAAKACPVFDYREVLGLDGVGRLGANQVHAATPKEEVTEDVKPLAQSSTIKSVVGTGTAVTTGAVTVSQNVDKLTSTQTGLLIVCGVVVLGCLFWIWRERKRRGAEFGF